MVGTLLSGTSLIMVGLLLIIAGFYYRKKKGKKISTVLLAVGGVSMVLGFSLIMLFFALFR